jgi:signal transduction histidine kinase
MADPTATITLHELLKRQREELIKRWGQRIAGSGQQSGQLAPGELLDRMPFFVDEIIGALYPEALPLPPAQSNAIEHGAQRFGLGFDVGEVVREYGMLQDCILDLAREGNAVVSLDEHVILNRWINGGIALALSQYVSQRELELQRQSSEHLGFIAHEVRNPLGAAQLAFTHLRTTVLATGGRAVDVLERNLKRTTDVVAGALTHASLKMGVLPHPQLIHLRPFIDDLVLESSVDTDSKRIGIRVEADPELTIDADARLLRSALSNLLHNAIKFTTPGHEITVRAEHHDARMTIEVHDGCGGLPPGKAEELFAPLVQRNENRTGFGLGLAIAMQAVQAHNGTVTVRDVPGKGCVFTIDLPASGSPPRGGDATA